MLRTPPAQRFRAAIATASLPHLIRLAGKLHAEDLRNTDPSTRQTSLVRAAATGRLDVVEWLIDEGHEEGEISRDATGDTLLHVAAAEGYVEIMELYLSHYPFVLDWVNARGATPLHVAAMKGEVDCAQLLVDYGADINAPDLQGDTPLHWASSWGKLPVVKLLIELGCQVGAKNNEGFIAAEYSFSFEGMKALEEYARSFFEYSKRNRSRKASKTPHLEGSPKPRRDSFSNPPPMDTENGSAHVGLVFAFNAVAGPSQTLPLPPLRNKSSSSQISPSSSLLALAPTSTALVTPASTGTFLRTTTSLSPLNLTRIGRSGSSSSNLSTVPPASPASESIRKISLRDQGAIETFRTVQGGSIGVPPRSQSFGASSNPTFYIPPSRSASFSTAQSDLPPPLPPGTRTRSESNNSLLSTSSAALTSGSRSGSSLSTPSLDPVFSTKLLPSPTPLRPPTNPPSPTPPPPPPNSSKPPPLATATAREEKKERRMSAVGASIVEDGRVRGRSGSNESGTSGGRVARALGLVKRS